MIKGIQVFFSVHLYNNYVLNANKYHHTSDLTMIKLPGGKTQNL